MKSLIDLISEPQVLNAILELEAATNPSRSQEGMARLFVKAGVDQPQSVIDQLVGERVFDRVGDEFSLTSIGARTALLMSAIRGVEFNEVHRKLIRWDTSACVYSVVREGMTKVFLGSLLERPHAGQIYVCSPWINLSKPAIKALQAAIVASYDAWSSEPEIIVITRPDRETGEAPLSVQPFIDAGAKIFLQKRLHTKLYIREPGPTGGYSMAIIGSQNLTKSSYMELGVKVESDSRMLRALISQFHHMTYKSVEFN